MTLVTLESWGRHTWLARTVSLSAEVLDKESLRSGQRTSSHYQGPWLLTPRVHTEQSLQGEHQGFSSAETPLLEDAVSLRGAWELLSCSQLAGDFKAVVRILGPSASSRGPFTHIMQLRT